MTSEVLMLNKDAVVIAADSAVTTGRDPHPRYSKAANKIFDLTLHGNVAVTIYSAAEIDNVPWELALKQFRKQDAGNKQRQKLRDYVDVLMEYLQSSSSLFPTGVLSKLLTTRLYQATVHVLEEIELRFPEFTDQSLADAIRVAAWSKGFNQLSTEFAGQSIQTPLTQADYKHILTYMGAFQIELAPVVANTPKYIHADIPQLAQLAIEALVKQPTDFLSYTGLVFSGYGDEEIFPSFHHIWVYGHIGNTLLWTYFNGYAITHDNDSWIQPFAQSSMIDRFTDGFDSNLKRFIAEGSAQSFAGIISDLQAAGVSITGAVSDPICKKRQSDFMDEWIRKNWEVNFHPLRRVLNSLSVSEMGHLAESLLVLEALRERVTSPSESVGGPIDVAVITKSEGLIWLKRKHFFDPQLNVKYLNRTKSDYN